VSGLSFPRSFFAGPARTDYLTAQRLRRRSLIAREDEEIAIIAIINSTMYARCLCNVNASLRLTELHDYKDTDRDVA
jgi:hypothetical protein